MAEGKLSLKNVFQRGFGIFKKLEDSESPANTKQFQDDVSEAKNCLTTAIQMANELALFSTNEDLDDISTDNLRYLLLPALLGDLTLKSCAGERIGVVKMSKVYLLDFLERCKMYGLFQQDIKFLESNTQSCIGNKRSLEDLAHERQAKIIRYKKVKEQEKQLQDLWKVLQEPSVSSHDEELERKYNILLLENWMNKALEHISSINNELRILEHMKQIKRHQKGVENEDNSDKVANELKPNKEQFLSKPILITRETIQNKVFGAGYPSLPTMTQEEYFEKELQEGKIVAEFRDKLTTESENSNDEQEVDKYEDEKYLEKLKKDREWDDWKDDNRRGWGNRENMG